SRNEWPRRCAWRAAVSTEITTSPSREGCRASASGNDSPSVGLAFPRYRRFRSWISGSVTRARLSSACVWFRCCRTVRTHRRSAVRLTPGALPETPIVIARLCPAAAERLSFLLGALFFLLRSLISGDHVLHQTVADHVFFAEKDELDAVDVLENLVRLFEPGAGTGGQVDLGDVAGNHRLGAVAETREKHFHLLAGGVLRLIQDHKRVVKRAATHEGERRHLDS